MSKEAEPPGLRSQAEPGNEEIRAVLFLTGRVGGSEGSGSEKVPLNAGAKGRKPSVFCTATWMKG